MYKPFPAPTAQAHADHCMGLSTSDNPYPKETADSDQYAAEMARLNKVREDFDNISSLIRATL